MPLTPLTSSKSMGVPGKHSSDHKHNPFSVLVMAIQQSAKAAKKRQPPRVMMTRTMRMNARNPGRTLTWRSSRKVVERPLANSCPTNYPKRKVRWYSLGLLRNPTGFTQAPWHSDKSGGTRRAPSCCAGSCVWPD